MADPEYDVEEVYELWSREPVDVIKTCRHANLTPVTSVVDGQIVAQLCTDCDIQLDADATPLSVATQQLVQGQAALAQQSEALQVALGRLKDARIGLVGPDRTPTAFWVPPSATRAWAIRLMISAFILSFLTAFVMSR